MMQQRDINKILALIFLRRLVAYLLERDTFWTKENEGEHLMHFMKGSLNEL